MEAEPPVAAGTEVSGTGPDSGPGTGPGGDPDGVLARRRRWAHLPEPIDPRQWTTTQPVERGPQPERDHDLARTLLLWGAG